VLVTGYNPLRIFLFKDGLVRFATESYEKVTKSNKDNVYKHLTNFSLNKNNPNFVSSTNLQEENRKSHKRSITDFLEEMSEQGRNLYGIWDGIEDICVKTLCSIRPQLKNQSNTQNLDFYNQCCFELLGFDILIDENLKPYLLEVNHNPSLFIESQVDKKIKESLVRDIFGIIGVQPEWKKKAMSLEKKIIKERITYGGLSKKNMIRLRDVCIKQKDKYMMKNRGNFKRIYPSTCKQEIYEEMLERSDEICLGYSQSTIMAFKMFRQGKSELQLLKSKASSKHLFESVRGKSRNRKQRVNLLDTVPVSPYILSLNKKKIVLPRIGKPESKRRSSVTADQKRDTVEEDKVRFPSIDGASRH